MMYVHSVHYMLWAVRLETISPIARLLAIWMANYGKVIRDGSKPAEPTCSIEIERTLSWLGCSESELLLATEELIGHGVSPVVVTEGRIEYSLPDLPDFDEPIPPPRPTSVSISIYVITAGSNATKIGITKFPDYRLQNLQSANPMQRLEMVWQFTGPATIVRRVEREAHGEFADKLIGHEWFEIPASDAIETVKRLLRAFGYEL